MDKSSKEVESQDAALCEIFHSSAELSMFKVEVDEVAFPSVIWLTHRSPCPLPSLHRRQQKCGSKVLRSVQVGEQQ